MTRKAILDKTGVFDESLMVMFEESDLAMRIRKLGYDIEVFTSAKTYHDTITPNEKNVNKLRRLGIETSERAYCFAKNRNIFVERYSPWYGKLLYKIVFKRLFATYYFFECINNKRIDIAKAYLKGARYKIS